MTTPNLVAAGSGLAGAAMLLFTDLHTDWTPAFLIVFGIVAAVCLGALVVGYLETRLEVRAAEVIAEVTGDE